MLNSAEDRNDSRGLSDNVIATIMPILVMNQVSIIASLNEQVRQAIINEDKAASVEIIEKIFAAEISPVKSIIQLFLMGGSIQPGTSYGDLEVGIRQALAMQFKQTLPPLVLELFNAGMVDAADLGKILEKDASFDMAYYIKELAITTSNEEELDSDEEELDYSELAVVIAIKQKNWDFILKSDLLYEGILEDHPELMSDIYDSHRHDLIQKCIECNAFGANDVLENINEVKDGQTRLMVAATEGDVEGVKALLAYGADPTIMGEDGNNALMCAVTYTAEELEEINQPSRKRSDAIQKKMQARLEIVRVLTNDKRISINDRNKMRQTAFEIAASQGLVKNDKGFYELRGDHDVMEILLRGGSTPIFGQYEWSFKAKSMMTLGLSVAVTGLKNHLIRLSGLGIVGRLLFSPVIEFLNVICDSIVAYKAYYDARNPLYKFTRTFLDNEYANDAFFDLAKKPLVGAFYVNWYGKVIAGEDLKKYLANHVGYTSVSKGYFTESDMPKTEDGKLRLSIKEKVELRDEIFNNYFLLRTKLNGFRLPWTREGMSDVVQELESVYSNIDAGFVLPDEVMAMIVAISDPQNHAKVVEDVLASEENKQLFFQIHGLIKSGAVFTDLETRYNYELLAMKMRDPKLLEKGFVQRVMDSSAEKSNEGKHFEFNKFAEYCNAFDYQGYTFASIVHAMNANFAKDLKENRDVRNFWEKFKDGSSGVFHNVVNKAADGVGYVLGTDREAVLGVASSGVAAAGASANAAAHVGARRFYDSSYFLPACFIAAMAYLTVKWPDKMWKGCKVTFGALKMVIGLLITAIASVFKAMKGMVATVRSKMASSTAIDVVTEGQKASEKSKVVVPKQVMKKMQASRDLSAVQTSVESAAVAA